METKETDRRSPSITSAAVTRRAFLSGAGAAAIGLWLAPLPAFCARPRTMLHVAASSGSSMHVHTYLHAAARVHRLPSTPIEDFAAMATHPRLPVLYVARDCALWCGLPRGVVETYAVHDSHQPLKLLSQTPMALSATGPRSLTVSTDGDHLLVSASTGGAWNAFTLAVDGTPSAVALACKETGLRRSDGAVLLPAPGGAAFSPRHLLAAGVDAGCGRLVLMQPGEDGLVILDRHGLPDMAAAIPPVWTSDGRFLIAAGRNGSLHSFKIGTEPDALPRLHPTAVTAADTPVIALASHPETSGIFVLRTRKRNASVEIWNVSSSRLQLEQSISLSGRPSAMTQRADQLWIAAGGRLHALSLTRFDNVRSGADVPEGTVLAMTAHNFSA